MLLLTKNNIPPLRTGTSFLLVVAQRCRERRSLTFEVPCGERSRCQRQDFAARSLRQKFVPPRRHMLCFMVLRDRVHPRIFYSQGGHHCMRRQARAAFFAARFCSMQTRISQLKRMKRYAADPARCIAVVVVGKLGLVNSFLVCS